MTRREDGGPAYPSKRIYRDSQGIDHEVAEPGMSLRDWFAGQAGEYDVETYREYHPCDTTGDYIPRYSREQAKYRYADAMIAARAQTEGAEDG